LSYVPGSPGPLLLRNLLTGDGCGSEGEAEGLRLCFQPEFRSPSISLFRLREDAVVVRLPGRKEMVDDPCQFVGGSGDCFGGAQLGPHPSIELAQRRLAVLKGLGCHAEGKGDAVLDPSGSAPQHFPTTNVIVRTQSHPRTERGRAAKL